MSKMIKWYGRKGLWAAAATLGVIAGASFLMPRGEASLQDTPTFTLQKGTLQINVLQGGEIRALRNFEVKSEIELPTKILTLINEGYRITAEDIKRGKVLVELDSADIKDKINVQEIDYQNAIAAHIDADEQRAIQMSDNLSLMRESEQNMRFTLMDFERYVGKKAARAILLELKLPHDLEALDNYETRLQEAFRALSQASVPGPAKGTEPGGKEESPGQPAPAGQADPEILRDRDANEQPRIDFLAFLQKNEIGDGEAQQKLRSLNNDCLMRRAEMGLAKQNMEASEKLQQKEFISRTTLENDQVNFNKAKLAVEAAETQLDLFNKYEFPKQAEQYLSGYEEALKKLQRTIRANRARMAQAESKYETARNRYEVTLNRKNDLERQFRACVIRAREPGLVAYGSHDQSNSYRNNDVIEEGASVRFRQAILTIPNMQEMGVKVNVHESQVKKVRIGQNCRINVDAEPGKTLEGVVAELAVLPDSSSSRYTPNLKVYPATVHIKGTHDWLKPGMNAKVEIIVDQLDDILYVPVQSIEVENDHYFAYVNTGAKLERREVETGSFNDEFIEVKRGLAIGEQVALAIPKRTSMEAPEALPTSPPPKKKDKDPAVPKKGLASR